MEFQFKEGAANKIYAERPISVRIHFAVPSIGSCDIKIKYLRNIIALFFIRIRWNYRTWLNSLETLH